MDANWTLEILVSPEDGLRSSATNPASANTPHEAPRRRDRWHHATQHEELPLKLLSPAPLRVSVIVVNFNGGSWVLECLAALRDQTFEGFATIVIDNASTDGSADEIAARFPDVRLIHAPKNLGFAAGVNLGVARMPPSDCVALLNPDALPNSDWLAKLVEEATKHPEAGAFGSLMYADVAHSRIDGIGDVYHVSGRVWRQGHGRPAVECRRAPRNIFAPCAAAALYRVDALTVVGGLDEDFFCYLEDVDLGFRMRLAGYVCRFVPQAVVRHAGSAIAGMHSDFQTYHGHRNLVWVYVKNMPGLLFWLFLPIHVLMNIASIVFLARRGQGGVGLQAKFDALRGLPRMWRKRRRIQKSAAVRPLAIARELAWRMR